VIARSATLLTSSQRKLGSILPLPLLLPLPLPLPLFSSRLFKVKVKVKVKMDPSFCWDDGVVVLRQAGEHVQVHA